MDTILFNSELVRIAEFQLNPDESQFSQQGFIAEPLIVFPKHPIWIQHEGRAAFVADTSKVNLYNKNQVYRRAAIDPDGDYCHSFHLNEEVLLQLGERNENHQRVFQFDHINCSRQAFIKQLQILTALQQPLTSMLEIEEQTINLFSLVLNQHRITKPIKIQSRQYNRHQALIESVKSTLQNNLRDNLSLQQIASKNHTSPFHLSRLFKQLCGMGLNQYRQQQKLRSACLLILNEVGLTEIAMQFGFASHSHFGASFKNYFGMTPSQFRRNRAII